MRTLLAWSNKTPQKTPQTRRRTIGVATLLKEHGFECAYDACPPHSNNFGGRPAPPLTQWTGTTVDLGYERGGGAWRVAGANVRYTPLSDHVPVVVDLVRT